MKSAKRTITPLDVVSHRATSLRIQSSLSALRNINMLYWWILLIAATIGIMFVVSAGNTPKSFAQTEAPASGDATDMPTMEDWDALAQCETDGDWQADTGNGYFGGIQFDQQTWDANGGEGSPHEASKEEQIQVAEKAWLERGWDPWPSCGKSKDGDFSIDKPSDDSSGSIIGASDGSDSTESSDSEGSEDEGESGESSDDSSEMAPINPRSRDEGDDEGASGTSDADRDRQNSSEGVLSNPGMVSDAMKEPEFASPLAYASTVVSDRYNTAQSACEFLASCRYRDASLYSYAPFKGGMDALNGVSNTLTGVASLLSGVSSFAFYAVQLLLTYALSIDFFSKGAYVVNNAFFQAGKTLHAVEAEPDGSWTYSSMAVLVYVIGFTILGSIVAFLFRGRGRSGGALKVAGLSLLFSATGIFMVVRAADNVSEEDGGTGNAVVAEELKDADLVQRVSADNDVVEMASDMNNWSMMSPGWIMTAMGQLSNTISGFVGQITQVMTGAVTSSLGQEMSQCDVYINGLHAAFSATPAAQAMGDGRVMTLLSYDRMVNSLFFQNYAAGAMSDTLGAQNAWCRMAEADTHRPAGQQAMISRLAGLNREAVGTGGFGLVKDSGGTASDDLVANTSTLQMPDRGGRSIEVTSGTLVAENGDWNFDTREVAVETDAGDGSGNSVEAQKSTISIASQYFGPDYGGVNPKAAREQARFYWAVCEWGKSEDNAETSDSNDRASFYPGREATVNPEWQNVVWAKGDANRTFSKEDCASRDIISAQPNKGFGEAWTSDNVDDIASSHFEFLHETSQQETESGDDGDDSWLDTAADWIGGKWSQTWRSVPGLGAVGEAKDAMGDVMDWLTRKSPSASDMHGARFQSAQPMVGSDSAMTYLQRANGEKPMGGIVSSVLSIVVGYVIVRMVGGMIIGALLIQVLTMLVFAFGALLLLIAMIPIRMVRNGLRMTTKTIVTSMLTDGFMVFVFGAVFAFNEMLRAMIMPVTQDVLSGSILGGVIALLAFYAFNLLVKQFTQLDMTKFSDAVKLAPIALSPALARAGFMTRNPFDIGREGLRRLGFRRRNRAGVDGQPVSRPDRKRQDQANRERVRNDYADSNAQKQKRRDEADDKRAAKQREKQENQKKRRAAADTASTAASFVPYANVGAKAHKVASGIWRPVSDAARKTGRGAANIARKTGRMLRDGVDYGHEQADLVALGKSGYISDTWKDRTGNSSPGDTTTATDEQRARTGQAHVDADNAEQFDEKMPGSVDHSGDTESPQSVDELLDQHESVDTHKKSTPVDAADSQHAAYDTADAASGAANTPGADTTTPSGTPMGKWSNATEQQVNEGQRRMSEQTEQQARKQQTKESRKAKVSDAAERAARGLADQWGRGSGDPTQNRRDANAQSGSKGLFGRAARDAADRMERSFRNRFDT